MPALKITITYKTEIVVEPADETAFKLALENHRANTSLEISETGFCEMIAKKVEKEGFAAAAQFGAKAYILTQTSKTIAKPHSWE